MTVHCQDERRRELNTYVRCILDICARDLRDMRKLERTPHAWALDAGIEAGVRMYDLETAVIIALGAYHAHNGDWIAAERSVRKASL